MSKLKEYKMFIGGEWVDSESKKIANSKVKIVSNGKHLCSIECADDVNNAIKEHIKNE